MSQKPFTTTGTGPIYAVGITANWLVVIESLVGPFSLVLAGGLLLARLIRPRVQVRFTHDAGPLAQRLWHTLRRLFLSHFQL